MLSWLTGGGGAAGPPPEERPYTPPPRDDQWDDPSLETPAPLFAMKAFRTAIFGTPAPRPPRQRVFRPQPKPIPEHPTNEPVENKQAEIAKPAAPAPRLVAPTAAKKEDSKLPVPRRSLRNRREEELKPSFASKAATVRPKPKFESGDQGKFKIVPHTNIFDPTSAGTSTELPAYLAQGTPARPSSPTKGILMTPGFTRQRKAVTFDSATKAENIKPNDETLPADFPGVFPNTPKSGLKRSLSVGSLEETSIPIESANKKRAINIEVTEKSRIQDFLNETDEDEDNLHLPQSVDLTLDIQSPKSASGKYWKEHAQSLEALALEKCRKYKERYNVAVKYAKEKDDFCHNLAAKLQETNEKSRLLKNEVKRLNTVVKLTSSGDDAKALSDAVQMLYEKEEKINQRDDEMAQMQLLLDEYSNKLHSYEKMLDTRENAIVDLSMSLYTPGCEDMDMVSVADLKQKLRKARTEVKELGPLRADFRASKARVTALEKEKENLQAQLERMKSVDDNAGLNRSAARVNNESRLRKQVDDLEKEKRDLKAEIKKMIAEASKDRREAEKVLRSETSDLKSKLRTEEMNRAELSMEVERLKEVVKNLEKDLAAKKQDQFNFRDDSHNEWQTKHRNTLQELRKAKDEIAQLKKAEFDNIFGAPSKMRYSSEPPFMDITNTVETKKPATVKVQELPPKKPSPSIVHDDFDIDRFFDRKNILSSGTNRYKTQMSSTPHKEPPPFFSLSPITNPSASKPSNDSFFSFTPILPRTNYASQAADKPAPPDEEFGSMAMDFGGDSFRSAKRAKASPRPNFVSWETSPAPIKRRTFGTAKKPAASKVTMDPERRAAAEKRLAERKAQRAAEKAATEAAL